MTKWRSWGKRESDSRVRKLLRVNLQDTGPRYTPPPPSALILFVRVPPAFWAVSYHCWDRRHRSQRTHLVFCMSSAFTSTVNIYFSFTPSDPKHSSCSLKPQTRRPDVWPVGGWGEMSVLGLRWRLLLTTAPVTRHLQACTQSPLRKSQWGQPGPKAQGRTPTPS